MAAATAAAAFQHKAQVYSPPYLFRGPQPVITNAPAAARLGQTFAVTTDRPGMASAMLVAPGATTHGNDMHQRAVKLAVVPSAQDLWAAADIVFKVRPPTEGEVAQLREGATLDERQVKAHCRAEVSGSPQYSGSTTKTGSTAPIPAAMVSAG